MKSLLSILLALAVVSTASATGFVQRQVIRQRVVVPRQRVQRVVVQKQVVQQVQVQRVVQPVVVQKQVVQQVVVPQYAQQVVVPYTAQAVVVPQVQYQMQFQAAPQSVVVQPSGGGGCASGNCSAFFRVR